MKKNLTSTEISIKLLPHTDTLVITQDGGKVFIGTPESIVISRSVFITLLNYMVKNGIISTKTIHGILEEYHTQ